MEARLIGVDWGSSSRRAYVIDGGGRCLHRLEDGEGALAARGRFAASLGAMLARLESECGAGALAGLPVVMSGMVGGAQGWQEVPYLDCGTPLSSLPDALVTLLDGPPGHVCRIVPGYRCGAGAEVDVMRGEETQLLGAEQLGLREGWAVLPGTHSKWVQLRSSAINSLSTFITGELFAMLQAGGTLAPLMAAGREPAHGGQGGGGAKAGEEKAGDVKASEAMSGDAMAAGAMHARRHPPLTRALFSVRARVVTGAMPAAHARDYVSGLLIGSEFVAAQDAGYDSTEALTLIGAPALAARYAAVAALFDFPTTIVDPHRAYCAALHQFL